MSTKSQKVNIFLKKFLSQQEITDNFLEYLQTLILDTTGFVWDDDGIFTPDLSATDLLTSSAVDAVTVTTPMQGTDGLGHILNLDPLEAGPLNFENALGIDYSIAGRFNFIPVETQINVRTSEIEYTFFEEAIGEIAEPGTVVDDGDETLTIIVDSVTEAGVSNAGRQVKVWLKKAKSQVDTFETLTVIWDGSNNIIETTTALGQTLGNISVLSTDYQVFLIGPTIKRNTDLSLDPNVLFLGVVTGVGAGNTPTNFNTDKVNQLFPNSAQKILDSIFSMFTGGGNITWDLPNQELTFTADLKLNLPHRNFNFNIVPTTITGIIDETVGWITKDEIGGVKVITTGLNGTMPNNPDSVPIFIRSGNDIFFRDGALELLGDVAGTTQGRFDGITQDLLTFIGAINESDSDPNYSNSAIVTQGGSLTNAIGELDAQVEAILLDLPKEEDFIVGPGGQTFFNTATMTFSTDNSIPDIIVWVNGEKQRLDITGNLLQDYRKTSSSQIEFSYTIPENARVTIRRENQGGGAGSVITSSGEWKVEFHTVTGPEDLAKQFTLLETPAQPNQVMVDIIKGSAQQTSIDYSIAGNVFGWNALGLDGDLSNGDIVRVGYFFTP